MSEPRDIIPRPRMSEVCDRIAALYGLTADEMRKALLSRRLAPARQHAMWEMHALGYSNMQIARTFGLTDHTSVVYGRQRHEARLSQVQWLEAAE